MKQGIREKCIDWAKSVVDSAISTPPLLSGEHMHISEHTYMWAPLWIRCERRLCRTFSIDFFFNCCISRIPLYGNASNLDKDDINKKIKKQ